MTARALYGDGNQISIGVEVKEFFSVAAPPRGSTALSRYGPFPVSVQERPKIDLVSPRLVGNIVARNDKEILRLSLAAK